MAISVSPRISAVLRPDPFGRADLPGRDPAWVRPAPEWVPEGLGRPAVVRPAVVVRPVVVHPAAVVDPNTDRDRGTTDSAVPRAVDRDHRLLLLLRKVNPDPCRILLFLLPVGRINPAAALLTARRDLGTTGAEVNTTKRRNNNNNNTNNTTTITSNNSNSRRWNRNLKCHRSRITNFPRD